MYPETNHLFNAAAGAAAVQPHGWSHEVSGYRRAHMPSPPPVARQKQMFRKRTTITVRTNLYLKEENDY